jgi:hypothetical protein
MRLHHIAVGVVFVSIILLGIFSYVGSLEEGYGETMDLTGLENTSARLRNHSSNMEEIYEDINDEVLNPSAGQALLIPYTLIKLGWKSAKSMFDSWVLVGEIAVDLENNMGEVGIPIPDYIIPSLMVLIIISIIAMAIYAFFKWKFED